jgi:2-amino-1-hydroxyethylphosphonate dioxygenase (glycine-forming)
LRPVYISAAEELISLLESADGQYLGGPVTQLEHALQCAHFARSDGADDDTILAALLHDVGHLIATDGESGCPEHNRIGAAYLKQLGLGGYIAALVSSHVAAKRYLVATQPGYYDLLSHTSKQNLAQQGGPMTSAEVHEFEDNPIWRYAIELRAWDERANVPGKAVEGLEFYKEMLQRRFRNTAPEKDL